MAYYFTPFPTVSYDIKKNNRPTILTNIMKRFKIVEAFQRQEAIYYNYVVKDGERADVIAFKYYGDSSLDWVIYLTNNIIDPEFDWPLSSQSLLKYIAKKYGSVNAAKQQIHQYQLVLNERSVLFDGTIIPPKYEPIDILTYNTLSSSEKRIVTSYEYEIELNDKKREIKLLSSDFTSQLLAQVNTVFE
jgi:hypothetical protein